MAQDYGLNIQDEASVREWMSRAEALNERAAQTVNEAAQALEEFKETAEGNVFEQVCEYGGNVISGMTKVLEGMNEILTAVNSIMEKAKTVLKDLVDGVGNVVSSVLG